MEYWMTSKSRSKKRKLRQKRVFRGAPFKSIGNSGLGTFCGTKDNPKELITYGQIKDFPYNQDNTQNEEINNNAHGR